MYILFFLSFATVGHAIVSDGHKLHALAMERVLLQRANLPYQDGCSYV